MPDETGNHPARGAGLFFQVNKQRQRVRCLWLWCRWRAGAVCQRGKIHRLGSGALHAQQAGGSLHSGGKVTRMVQDAPHAKGVV